jgi:hypothetical protein
MHYRTTAKGHRVAWDEPDPDVEDRIAKQIRKTLQDRKAKASRDRLKQKSAVPIKDGKPIFEKKMAMIDENLNDGLNRLRSLFYSGKVMDFKQWLNEVHSLIEEL